MGEYDPQVPILKSLLLRSASPGWRIDSHIMNPENPSYPAPCIVDTGILVNKQDMQRLLVDLGRVRYSHRQDGQVLSEGEGYILEVYADPQLSTLVANHALYLNVYSFDYLELSRGTDPKVGESCAFLDLVQDQRCLRLIPLSNPLQDQGSRTISSATLEAVVAEVLSAGWDVQIDDEEHFSF